MVSNKLETTPLISNKRVNDKGTINLTFELYWYLSSSKPKSIMKKLKNKITLISLVLIEKIKTVKIQEMHVAIPPMRGTGALVNLWPIGLLCKLILSE